MNSQSNVIKQTAAHPDGHNQDEICVRSRVGTPSDQTRPENFDVAISDHCDQGGYPLGLEKVDRSVSSRTRSKVQRSLEASRRKEEDASDRDTDDDSRTGRSRRSRTGQRRHHSSLTDDEVIPDVEDDTSDHLEERCRLTPTRTDELDDRYDATFCTQRRADCSDSWKATAGGATTGAQRGARLKIAAEVHAVDEEDDENLCDDEEEHNVEADDSGERIDHPSWGSEFDEVGEDWQVCDNEVSVRRPRAVEAELERCQIKEPIQSVKVMKKSGDDGSQTRMRDPSSQPVSMKAQAAVGDLSVMRRRNATRSDAMEKLRTIKVGQFDKTLISKDNLVSRRRTEPGKSSMANAGRALSERNRPTSRPDYDDALETGEYVGELRSPGPRSRHIRRTVYSSDSEEDDVYPKRVNPKLTWKKYLDPGDWRKVGKENRVRFRAGEYRYSRTRQDSGDDYEDDLRCKAKVQRDRSRFVPREDEVCLDLRRSAGHLKPEKYNGTTCFETFLVQFDNCAEYNHWNSNQKLHYLRWSLTGAAAQMLWGTENMSYKELVTRLRSRFGSLDMEEKYQTEIQCRRRKPSESLSELAQDIRRLMMLAYPGERSVMAERLAKEHFISALDDAELELKVREKEPQTLDSAFKSAQRLEVFRNAVEQKVNLRRRLTRQVTESDPQLEEKTAVKIDVSEKKQSGGKSKQGSQKHGKKEDKKRACATSVSSDEMWRDEMIKKIHNLEVAQHASEANAKKITAENDALTKEVERLRHLEQLRSVPLPATAQPVPPTPAPPQYRFNGNCHKCGQPGHIMRFCRQGFTQRSAGVRRRSDQNGTRVAIPSLANYDSYLWVNINGRLYDCLLDTGSEVCLLPEHVVDPSLLETTKRTLKAANGTAIPILGEVTLPVSIGEFRTQMMALVSPHVSEPMIGIDFLVENEALWDFGNSTIRFGDLSLTLQHRVYQRLWCRRVVLQDDVVVPPRSEVILPTNVQFQKLSTEAGKGLWGTEPTYIKEGLYVSCALLPDYLWADAPVRVMNVKEESKTLPAGTIIANLEQFEVVDATSVKQVESEENSVPDFIKKLVDGVDDSILESDCLALESILMKNLDVFSRDESDLGRTNIMMHHIDTADAKPVRQPLRRYPPAHVESISNHVDNMLKQDIIEPASSPWASNIVLVKKKDGSLRCCIDYRQLNSVTRKDVYPLPRIDSCLDAMASANLFSTFDLRSSYHQVEVAPQDRDKTTFICPRGMYRYKTMPFGLCNAGATFQRLMDVVMSGLHFDVCLVYLDDVILFSSSTEEHLERLVRILDRFRSAGLKLKPEKCSLMQRSVSFLGHVVSGDGIATDPEKIRVVAEWPVPISIKEVRSFLGLSGYYRRFVKGYADIAAPLHALLKKDQAFYWNEKTQKAFEMLRDALSSPPILAMPNDTGTFILDTDACDQTIGAVLSQVQDGVEKVIAYASRTLDKREMNYCITRKELLAIVHSLKFFKQYLLGRHFKVRTDHAPLTWLRHTPDPIGQQARWLEIIEEYDFSVEHRPGTKHGNADAISRRPCRMKSCVCRHSVTSDVTPTPSQEPDAVLNCALTVSSFTVADDPNVPSWSLSRIQEAQENDPDLACIVEMLKQSSDKPPWDSVALKSHDVRVLWGMWPRLRLHHGVLQRKFEATDGSSVIWQVILPVSLRGEFLATVHGGMTGGHLARRRTAASVQSRAYWPTWSTDLEAFLKGCESCARYYRGYTPKKARLNASLVGEPWFRVSVDITGPHPRSSKSNQYILTLVDHFSKWAEAIPLRNHTAVSVARALMTHVFSRFGAPQQLLTDRGSEFESELFKELMKWMEIDKLRTTAFHPSCNGTVERFHRTLNSMLAKTVSETQRDWDERLPLVLAAYRATVHESTGMSPNKLFLGREVRMPIDLVMGLPLEEAVSDVSPDEYLSKLRQNAALAYQLARKQLYASAERRKKYYDAGVRPERFAVGDWVFYHYPRRYTSRSPKWQKAYTGPYLVTRLIEPVNCVLQKSPRSKPFVVHVDKLKKCLGETPASWLTGNHQ